MRTLVVSLVALALLLSACSGGLSPTAPAEAPSGGCVDTGTAGAVTLDHLVLGYREGIDFGAPAGRYVIAQGSAGRGGICGMEQVLVANFELDLSNGAVVCADDAATAAAVHAFHGTAFPISVGPNFDVPVVVAFRVSLVDPASEQLYVHAPLSHTCTPTS